MNRIYKMCIMIAILIFADQVTKALVQQKFYLGESIPVIEGLFHLTYVRNPGAAFGMLGSHADWIRIPVLFILPVIACFWLLYLMWSVRHKSLIQCSAYALIFSGAVGNLIDRWSMNYVVDFFDFFYQTHHFPAFNIADSAITVAAILLIIDVLFFEKKRLLAENQGADATGSH
ncbi:MAG: signal peptidase II [Bacteriovoracaceae bacterium]|nr:signal peptidase II [Bacteriovoracaceae bacterium]